MPQPERIGDDEDAGDAHRRCREHRVQEEAKKWVESPGGDRDERDGYRHRPIWKLKRMVRSVRPARAVALTMPRRSPDIKTHVARLDGDIGAGADGDSDIGLGQRRRVVDAVADEQDLAAAGLEVF